MPDLQHHPESFHTAVHGTAFGERTAVVRRLRPGDELILVPDPPGAEVPAVWVHARGGDVVGHLPVHVGRGAHCGSASIADDRALPSDVDARAEDLRRSRAPSPPP